VRRANASTEGAMGELEIRELTEEDLDALLALYRQLHAQDEPLPARPEVEALWTRLCASPDHLYRGGFGSGELLASCCAAIVPNLTRGARPFAVIENVVTHSDHRGRGFGSAVLQSLLSSCWARSCYKVMLLSGAQRDAAHRFYEANGFDRHAKQGFVLRK
jgi:GNAT superfamily N-acetyltransferase